MKKFLALTLSLARALSLAACGSSASTDTASSSEAASTSTAATTEAAGEGSGAYTGTPIKIGGIGPVTGGAAIYGQAVKNAEELAVKEINADVKYKLIINATALIDADSTLNITPAVLAKVNALYAAD